MPIYIESRGVVINAQSIAEHQYLVYVPIGEENNYSAWLTIKGFPNEGLLRGDYIDVPLASSDDDDEWTFADFDPISLEEVASGSTETFESVPQKW